MTQGDLFAPVLHSLSAGPTRCRFDGATYDPQHDRDRLEKLLGRVWSLMQDGQWRTLAEIQGDVGGTEASVSARLRDLRKAQFGAYPVERRRRGAPEDGLFEYRIPRPRQGAAA